MPAETQRNLTNNGPEVASDEEYLSPEELRSDLTGIINQWTDLAQAGIDSSTVKMTGANGEEIFVEDELRKLRDLLESYEPLNMRDRKATVELENDPAALPVWLEEHSHLVWTGATENPFWEPKFVKADEGRMRVVYQRRDQVLEPGENELFQPREIPALSRDVFSVADTRVIDDVMAPWINKFKLSRSEDNTTDEKGAKDEAKAEILSLLKEYTAFLRPDKRGQGTQEAPTKLRHLIEAKLKMPVLGPKSSESVEDRVDRIEAAVAEMLSQLLVLNRERGDGKEAIPTEQRIQGIKEFPSFVRDLEEFSTIVDRQLGENGKRPAKGISYLLGDAGVGKNVLVEYFAAKTKRPFYWFPCSRGMQGEDLFYHTDYNPEKGTTRVLTPLAQGLQTPGSVVFIDEVTALLPSVQLILNGVGDGNRMLRYDSLEIPVAEGVVIVMASNPATYAASGNVSESLLDRAMSSGLAMNMQPPALLKGDMVSTTAPQNRAETQQRDNTQMELAVNEVLTLYDQLPEFRGLSAADFTLLWEAYLNESVTANQEILSNPRLENLINDKGLDLIKKSVIDLALILRIADAWRKYYSKREKGFDILSFSLRGSQGVTQSYASSRDVSKAFLQTFAVMKNNPIKGTDTQYNALEILVADTVRASSTTP